MTRPLPAAACAAALSCLLGLGACAGVPTAAVVLGAQAALAAASETYCTQTTEEAKRAVRAELTGGVPVVRCPGDQP